MQAISVGGGLTMRGTERGIRVNRHLPDGKVQTLQTATTDPVRENDVIFVRESIF
jgi:polysaccharide export outer membrane protein